MKNTILALSLLFTAAAAQENRVFGMLGSASCRACLKDVESTCKGPITSSQFNDCFCTTSSESSSSWSVLKSCVTDEDTQCSGDKVSILDLYAMHCLQQQKSKYENQLCDISTQDDELLLPVADDHCTEFKTYVKTRFY